MLTKIDPCNLTSTMQQNLLFLLLSTNNKFWYANYNYVLSNSKQISLSHGIVRRKCNSNNNEYRYEVLSDTPINEGGSGKIYQSLATIYLDQKLKTAHSKLKAENKQRIVKYQQINCSSTINVLQEYDIAKKNVRLKIKEPTLLDNNSWLVMRYLKGKELFKLLAEDIGNKYKNFSILQRINLSLALLKALKTQITDNNIIHCDIKPDNILVNFCNEKIKVTIIDFGLSLIDEDKPIIMKGGTYGYAPPEFFLKQRATVKSDVFSMARTIALLWGVHEKFYSNDKICAYVNANLAHSNIFDNDNFKPPTPHLKNILNILKNMLVPIQEKRLNIEEAITAFENINEKIVAAEQAQHNYYKIKSASTHLLFFNFSALKKDTTSEIKGYKFS